MSDRLRALLAVLGVLAFTLAWVLAGLRTEGFDPVRQSISQLQRDGTMTGAVMTVAFVAFAAGGLAVAPVLGRRLGRAPQVALTVASLATLGAAASPLGQVRGGAQDIVHLSFGTAGYTALSVLPLLAGWALRYRARRVAGASLLLGAVASACLLGTVPAEAVSGALQRVGFLAGHLWLVGFAVVVLRSSSLRRSCAPGRGTDLRGRHPRTPSSPR